jgi:hypothetical protein
MEYRQLRVDLAVQAAAAEGATGELGPLDHVARWLREQLPEPELLAVWVRGRQGLSPEVAVEAGIDTSAAVETAERLAAQVAKAPGVISVGIEEVLLGERLYRKTCRVGGETFFAREPRTEICRDHWYSEELDAAQRQYQPLIDAIEQATGMESWVWQSGGMTMTLVTGSDDPYEGERYLTLVEGFHEDGTLEGSAGFYSASGDNDEGEPVVMAYVGGEDKPSEGAGFARPILPVLWAEIIANHQRSRGGGR